MSTESVKASVVRIEASTQSGFVVCGTGFVMGGQGLVATCDHVVADVMAKAASPKKVMVRFGDGQPVAYSVLIQDADLDLALLAPDADSSRRKLLRLAEAFEPILADGTELEAFGHGNDTVGGSRLISVKITNHDRLRSRYVIEAGVIPGDSGGPVVDGAEKVVAIVSSKHVSFDGIGKAIPVGLLHQLIRRSSDLAPFFEKIDDATSARAALRKRLADGLLGLNLRPEAAYGAYARIGLPPAEQAPEGLEAILDQVSVNPRIAILFLAHLVHVVDPRLESLVVDLKRQLADDLNLTNVSVPPPNGSGRLPALIGVVRNLEATTGGGEFQLYAWVGRPWIKLEPPTDSILRLPFGRSGFEAAARAAIELLLEESGRRGEDNLSLEFVLPVELVAEAVDRITYGRRGQWVIGEKHRVTIRLLDRLRESERQYKIDWRQRWSKLSGANNVLKDAVVIGGGPLPTNFRQEVRNKHALVTFPSPATDAHHEALCDGLIDQTIPFALWIRGGEGSDASVRALVDQSLNDVLDAVDNLRQNLTPIAAYSELQATSIAILLDPYEEGMPLELLNSA